MVYKMSEKVLERIENTRKTARNKQIVEMYNSGKNLREVGAEFGITHARVGKIIEASENTDTRGKNGKPKG